MAQMGRTGSDESDGVGRGLRFGRTRSDGSVKVGRLRWVGRGPTARMEGSAR